MRSTFRHFLSRRLRSTGGAAFRACAHFLGLNRNCMGPCHGPLRLSSGFQEHTVIEEHPCPNHNSVRVPRAYGHRASMPKPEQRSCSKSIRSSELPCPNQNSVRVPRAYGHHSIHAQTIIRVPSAYGHQSMHAQTMIVGPCLT